MLIGCRSVSIEVRIIKADVRGSWKIFGSKVFAQHSQATCFDGNRKKCCNFIPCIFPSLGAIYPSGALSQAGCASAPGCAPGWQFRRFSSMFQRKTLLLDGAEGSLWQLLARCLVLLSFDSRVDLAVKC